MQASTEVSEWFILRKTDLHIASVERLAYASVSPVSGVTLAPNLICRAKYSNTLIKDTAALQSVQHLRLQVHITSIMSETYNNTIKTLHPFNILVKGQRMRM